MSKKHFLFFALIISTSLVLGGCAGLPSKEKITNLDYGSPLTGDYKPIVEQYFKAYLKDPYSAKFERWEEPVKFWVSTSYYTAPMAGYIVFVWINAKNGFGAYDGVQRYGALFKNGSIIGGFEPQTLISSAGIVTSEGESVSCKSPWDMFLHCP